MHKMGPRAKCGPWKPQIFRILTDFLFDTNAITLCQSVAITNKINKISTFTKDGLLNKFKIVRKYESRPPMTYSKSILYDNRDWKDYKWSPYDNFIVQTLIQYSF